MPLDKELIKAYFIRFLKARKEKASKKRQSVMENEGDKEFISGTLLIVTAFTVLQKITSSSTFIATLLISSM